MPQQNLLNTFRIDPSQVKKSQKWYAEQVSAMKNGRFTAKKLIMDSNVSKVSTIRPGSLFFFRYDPKGKATLPYYDTFPMVFPFRAMPDGFLGLNLHYLGYKERFAVFNKLLQINGSDIHEDLKMKFSWGVISNVSSIRAVSNCVKHYLYAHVESQFIKIAPRDWTTCMLLPVESFVGAKKEYVWNQSKKA